MDHKETGPDQSDAPARDRLTRHTFHLEREHVLALKRLHPNLKTAAVIRRIIASYVAQMERRGHDLSSIKDATL